MEKWKENGMRKLMMVGEKMSRHLEGDVLQDECVGRHLRASLSLKIKT